MEQCIALVDYDALAPDEISFRKGDIINVTAKGSASGFWEGYVVSRQGHGNPSALSSSPSVKGSSRAAHPKETAGRSSSATHADGDSAVKPNKPGVFANCFVSSNLRNMTSSSFLNKAVCLYDYNPPPSSSLSVGREHGVLDRGEKPSTHDADGAAGEVDSEMAFSRGDVLTVVRPSTSPGWWFGVNETARQRVQLRMLQGHGDTHAARAATNATDRGRTEAQTQATGASTDQVTAQRLPLSHHTSNSATGGSAGEKDTDGALTPSQVARVDALCGTKERPLLFPCNYVSCDVVQAVFTFHGRQSHELSCTVGDVILVHRRWNDGWWEGSLRGRRGIFPSNYTAPNICTSHPAFFCPRCKTIYDDTQSANMALFLQHDDTGNVATGSKAERPKGVALTGASASVSSTLSGSDVAGAINLWRKCATCAHNASVTDSMLSALAAFDDGELDTPDLFAFVKTMADDNKGNYSTTDGGSRGASADSAQTDDAAQSHDGRYQQARRWSAPHDVALLNAKDVADISAGRVKF